MIMVILLKPEHDTATSRTDMKVNLGELVITSATFKHGQPLPPNDGAGAVSPPLEWANVPEGTKSFAIVAHDPDAPLVDGFAHWVVYNIPATATALPAGATEGFTAGANGMDTADYLPPGPPPGHGDHFYYFHLYALRSEPDLPEGLGRLDLLATVDEDIIEQARIVGTYAN
jgi:Raf kinase inhibitor-like YbhB/YbcL family protein